MSWHMARVLQFDNKKKETTQKLQNAAIVRCTGVSHIIQLQKSLFQHLVHIEVLFFSMWQFLC